MWHSDSYFLANFMTISATCRPYVIKKFKIVSGVIRIPAFLSLIIRLKGYKTLPVPSGNSSRNVSSLAYVLITGCSCELLSLLVFCNSKHNNYYYNDNNN